MENPFWYRALGIRRGRWQRWLLLGLGPLLLVAPQVLDSFLGDGLSGDTETRLGMLFYVAYLCLRGLMSTVGTVSQERERGSWECLYAAGLTPRELFWGLWSSKLIPLLLEVLLVLPWVVAHWRLPSLAGLLISMMWFAGSLGLFASLRFPSSFQAAQFAYGWLGLGAASAFMGWIWGELGWRHSLAYRGLWCINPWSQVLELERNGQGGTVMMSVYAILSLLLMWGSLSCIGRPHSRQKWTRRRRRASENPILYRNASSWKWLRLGLVYLIVIGLCSQLDRSIAGVSCLIWHTAFWLLLVSHGNCQVLCREKEQGSLDALLATRLSIEDIASGFWRQGVRPLLLLSLLLSPALLIALEWRWLAWLGSLLVTEVSVAAWGALALSLSLRSRTTLRAFQQLYLSLGALMMGTLFLDVCVLDPVFGFRGPILSLVNPMLAQISLSLDRESGGVGLIEWTWLFCVVFHLVLLLLASLDLRWRLRRG